MNVILSHTAEDHSWGFRRVLSESSGIDFEVEYMSTGRGDSRLRSLFCYVVFPWLVFLRRKRYECIVANQQFYGILLAFYCRLFGVRKSFRLFVNTFIYLPKHGLVGRLYFAFMRYAVQSPYIDGFIVRSSHEAQRYPTLFATDASRFVFQPLGLAFDDHAPQVASMRERQYILSVGRSNRDYTFLIDALQGSGYHADIICDTCTLQPSDTRIVVHRDIHEALPLWLQNCYCVVIPLRDTEVSSGQLVLLQAMQAGKPVIVTRAHAVLDYMIPGETGIAISNTRGELLEALSRLYNDDELYTRLSARSRQVFSERYSAEQEAIRFGQYIAQVMAS